MKNYLLSLDKIDFSFIWFGMVSVKLYNEIKHCPLDNNKILMIL